MMGMPGQFGGMAASSDFNHRLLSLDGPALYYQTNLGAVVGTRGGDGATLWVATYPRQEPNPLAGNGSERDLNPAVVHDGRVFVAPSDADAIFAFDAATGRLLWKSNPISDDVKLTHLLGVAKDRLVATGDRVLLFDVKTGELRPRLARLRPVDGRAMAAGSWRAILSTGRPRTRSRFSTSGPRCGPSRRSSCGKTYHMQGGNLVAGDGYLIVAQADGHGRLLPEQPADRTIPERNRPRARSGGELLPGRPGRRGDRPRPARA